MNCCCVHVQPFYVATKRSLREGEGGGEGDCVMFRLCRVRKCVLFVGTEGCVGGMGRWGMMMGSCDLMTFVVSTRLTQCLCGLKI